MLRRPGHTEAAVDLAQLASELLLLQAPAGQYAPLVVVIPAAAAIGLLGYLRSIAKNN